VAKNLTSAVRNTANDPDSVLEPKNGTAEADQKEDKESQKDDKDDKDEDEEKPASKATVNATQSAESAKTDEEDSRLTPKHDNLEGYFEPKPPAPQHPDVEAQMEAELAKEQNKTGGNSSSSTATSSSSDNNNTSSSPSTSTSSGPSSLSASASKGAAGKNSDNIFAIAANYTPPSKDSDIEAQQKQDLNFNVSSISTDSLTSDATLF